MTLKQTLIRNSIWIYSSDIIGKVLSYFLIVAIARNLGDIGLGEYSFIFAFASLSILPSELGMTFFLMKETARDAANANKYIPAIISIRTLLSVVAFTIFAVFSLKLGRPSHVVTGLYIALTMYLLSGIGDISLSILQARNNIKRIAVANVFERALAFAGGLYVLIVYKSLIMLIAVLFVSNLLRQFILFISAKELVMFRLDFDIGAWKEVLSRSIPFWFMGVFMTIYYKTDTIMLSLMVGDKVTGIYNAAYKLTETMMFIPSMMLFVLVPSISYLFKQNLGLMDVIVKRAFKYLFYITFPMIVGTLLLSDRFINFIYQDQFASAAGVLQVLIIATFFAFINTLLANILTATDKERYFLKTTATLAAVNILLNYLLIPKYAALGAAAATAITQAANFVIANHYVSKFLLDVPYLQMVWKPMLASVIMCVAISAFWSLAIWYILPFGAAIYFLAILILGIDKEDKAIIRDIFK